ncbi:MAG: hypothetical protein V1903_09450 [Bacteroidota bacterium]
MKSPFKFLDSYTKEDREIFFGRDREIEELYHRVFESRIMLVYGVSGTGKSSLIHCGLANKFQDTDWLPIVTRRGGNIIGSMAAGIRSASLTDQQNKFSSPADFKKGVRSLYLDHYKPVFFIFDQFEELFIFGDKEERRSFIQIVKSLTESELQCRMIFVMREEYMAGVTEFEKFIPTFFSNRVRIEKMSHRNALEAIKQPCKVFNISLEEGFAESLLEKLSPDETDVELTYLQVFLDKIFRLSTGFLPPSQGGKEGEFSDQQESKESITFTSELLHKTGNVSDLLGSFLDDQIALMEDPDTAMSVLKAFVSGKGTKRPASEQEVIDNIRSFGKEISPEKVKELIQSFVKLRVLRDKDDDGRYELRHDALAEKVYEKFSTAEKELLEIRLFIENSYQSFLKRKILLNQDDLAFIANKDSLLNLSPELQEFINVSRKHQKATFRTVKILTFISAAAFLLLLSTILYTITRRSKTSWSVQHASKSALQFTRPIDQLSLASAAWQSFQNEEAKGALFQSFNNLIRNPGTDSGFNSLREKYIKEFKPVSSSIEFAECSENDSLIYAYSADSIFIWSRNGDLLSGFNHGKSTIISLLMSNDGQLLGSVNIDSALTVWDKTGKTVYCRQIEYNPINKDQVFKFTNDNKVLTISTDNNAELIDHNGNAIQSFSIHTGNVNAVDISDDNQFITTAASDGKIGIWHLKTGQQKYEIYDTITSHSDTVWSVDFAKNGRYIVSTSSDGRIRISSINNKMAFDISDEFTYGFMNETMLGFPNFTEFDESGTGILLRSTENIRNREDSFMAAIYVDIYYHFAQAGGINKFDYIDFSPDGEHLVSVIGEDATLISRYIFTTDNGLSNNYRLLQFKGTRPFFSHDGKYIFAINGDHLESWYIDINTISQIALDYYNNWSKNLQ